MQDPGLGTASGHTGSLPAPSLGAWSPWRLRAAGAGSLQAALLGAGFARDNRAAAYAAEALERWSALATCLAGGRLDRGTAAASELLLHPEVTSTGRRVEAYVTHLTDDDYLLGGAPACWPPASRPLAPRGPCWRWSPTGSARRAASFFTKQDGPSSTLTWSASRTG
ncbi:unnamed protein product, partial [Prorocentrum cordatum]